MVSSEIEHLWIQIFVKLFQSLESRRNSLHLRITFFWFCWSRQRFVLFYFFRKIFHHSCYCQHPCPQYDRTEVSDKRSFSKMTFRNTRTATLKSVAVLETSLSIACRIVPSVWKSSICVKTLKLSNFITTILTMHFQKWRDRPPSVFSAK